MPITYNRKAMKNVMQITSRGGKVSHVNIDLVSEISETTWLDRIFHGKDKCTRIIMQSGKKHIVNGDKVEVLGLNTHNRRGIYPNPNELNLIGRILLLRKDMQATKQSCKCCGTHSTLTLNHDEVAKSINSK